MDRQIEFCSVLEGEGSMQTVRKKNYSLLLPPEGSHSFMISEYIKKKDNNGKLKMSDRVTFK